MKVLFATTNRHKIEEACSILEPLGISVVAAPPLEVTESEVTFEANAEKKAREYALKYESYCLADDSGLIVYALNGLPGVYSARFGALDIDWEKKSICAITDRECTDRENYELLLSTLKGSLSRNGAYISAVCLASPTGETVASAVGRCELTILEAPRGSAGFGYDPICAPVEGDFKGRTFAELSQEEKNAISHRGKALRALVRSLPANFHRLP